MSRVNLFIIGTQKSGTSWLYYLLDSHPEIFMCTEKELYYFGKDYPANLEAYHAHFPFGESYRYFGEATPTYYRQTAIAEKLIEYNPEAKCLAIMRDPIDRLCSEFYYYKQLGLLSESLTIDNLTASNTRALRESSHYEETLPSFEEKFGPCRFKTLSLEDSVKDVHTMWDQLQTFLGVTKVPVPAIAERPSNSTGSRSFRMLYRAIVRPVKMHYPILYRAMLRNKAIGFMKGALLHTLGTARKANIPFDTREQLLEEFAPTYRYLSRAGFEYDTPSLIN